MNNTLWNRIRGKNKICSHDYKQRHNWEFVGLIIINSIAYKVFTCSQCGKSIRGKLEWLLKKDGLK